MICADEKGAPCEVPEPLLRMSMGSVPGRPGSCDMLGCSIASFTSKTSLAPRVCDRSQYTSFVRYPANLDGARPGDT